MVRRSLLSVLVALLSTIQAAVPDAALAGHVPCSTQPSNAFEYIDFAGPWERHGMALEVGRLGCGTLTWRAYRWCAPGRVEGCDRVQDGAVRFGGWAEFTLDVPHGTAVAGRILATSAPARFAEREIGLALGDDGTLTVEWDGEGFIFCRPWLHDPLRCGA